LEIVMVRLNPRNGQGKLGCILWLLVLLAVVGVAAKLIPIKIRSAELYDYMEEQALFAGRSGTETLKKRILERAKDLDLPLDKKNLKVERRGGRIQIRATYTVPVELPGYTYYWEFEHMIDRPIFVV
jgi:hypothetical protein